MGLAVSPYAPAWKTTTSSPISARGQLARRARARPAACTGTRRRCCVSVGSPGSRAADRDRVVALDDLAEVARRGELVVHPAVDDEERGAARLLAVDDAGDVDAGLADEVAPELDDDARLRQQRPHRAGHEVLEVRADRGEVQRRVALVVRDAEAAADVEVAHGPRRVVGEPQRELDGPALRLAEDLGVEVLRAGEDVEAEPVDVGRARARRAARARARRRRRTAAARRPSSCPSP